MGNLGYTYISIYILLDLKLNYEKFKRGRGYRVSMDFFFLPLACGYYNLWIFFNF